MPGHMLRLSAIHVYAAASWVEKSQDGPNATLTLCFLPEAAVLLPVMQANSSAIRIDGIRPSRVDAERLPIQRENEHSIGVQLSLLLVRSFYASSF